MRRRLVRGGLVALSALALGAVVIVSGVIPVTARGGHWKITEWFLHFTMQRSVATRSMGIEAPPLDDRRLVLMGAGHYELGCRPCHGAPGSGIPRVPQHMTPPPPELSPRIVQYDDAELFYIVHEGIKMTAMPAWPAQGRADEVWGIVAFLRTLPELDQHGYARLVHGDMRQGSDAPQVVLERCARCHGADGLGRGEGAFPRLAGQRPAYLRASLRAYAAGARHSGIMEPIAAELDDAQLREVVAWYAGRPRPTGSGIRGDGRGEEIALRGIPDSRVPACAHCHGPGHAPYHPTYPELAGQYREYLAQQLDLFAQQARGGTEYAQIMQIVTAHDLEEADIEAVSAYYQALPPEAR